MSSKEKEKSRRSSRPTSLATSKAAPKPAAKAPAKAESAAKAAPTPKAAPAPKLAGGKAKTAAPAKEVKAEPKKVSRKSAPAPSQEAPKTVAQEAAPARAPRGLSAAKALHSAVEEFYYKKSGRQLKYEPTEKIPVIEVPNFPSLGRLTALRFIEWVLENPDGVVSLPTGKTPEYFIKWTQHFLSGWDEPSVQKELAEVGLAGKPRPSFERLKFVQIDEFYPIDPAQQNSFYYYVNKHYIKRFGIDPKNALLINTAKIGVNKSSDLDEVFPDGKVDLMLRHREPKTPMEKRQLDIIRAADEFCSDYEAKIREMGGIGFFLGGIGPDGHIGFNVKGSDLQSPTRLTYTNYETEAAAAGDLGGIEISRNKPVITIGLGTISFKKDAVVIIFAAGEAKSKTIADAITSPKSVLYPASILQDMPNARFYLTYGATIKLEDRLVEDIQNTTKLSVEEIDKRVINCALANKKRLAHLNDRDAERDALATAVINKTGKSLAELARDTERRLKERIEKGITPKVNETILHTGPHHDDISLAYMPYVMHLVRIASTKNYFSVLTSGFTAVTNNFLCELFEQLRDYLDQGYFEADIDRNVFNLNNMQARREEVFRFLDGIASFDEEMQRFAQARRTLYNMIAVYEDEDINNLKARLTENIHYLKTTYPGKKDVRIIQLLKGMQREFEEELIWGYVGTGPEDVFHMRLGFYTGDIFTKAPTADRDVTPVLKMYEELKPTIVSLAFDPEGTGPDTHYKVLQVLHEALIQYRDKTGNEPVVWGYRNVWHRFHPADANLYVPATLNTMSVMHHSFINCFGSQKNASFPSFEFDGPFSLQAQKMMVDQFQMLRTLLGHEFFEQNESPRLRAARGFIFIKEMPLSVFSGQARALAEVTEAAQ
ncbi:MAG: glucosamine-6-phosphate deaminase [Candidatus Sumerlaeia bacterium]|nr:glucosamine-6-phosphate deaminase [Candidatus Sumerlaeia bacterium]